MSKTEENPQGVISLFDTPEDVEKKIMRATTDSLNQIKFDEENQPGISNLINIASSLTGKSISDIEKEFEGIGYGEFKKYVAEVTKNFIINIQDKYNSILNSDELNKILDNGRDKTVKLAKEKYELMKERMGVTRKDITK